VCDPGLERHKEIGDGTLIDKEKVMLLAQLVRTTGLIILLIK